MGVVDIGLLMASPQLALDVLPVELALLCPISVVRMMRHLRLERAARNVSTADPPERGLGGL